MRIPTSRMASPDKILDQILHDKTRLDRGFETADNWNMKTTVDIPEKMLSEAMKSLGAATKREAVIAALEEFNRRRRAEKLVSILGTFKDFMTQEELQTMRSERDKRHEKRWHGTR